MFYSSEYFNEIFSHLPETGNLNEQCYSNNENVNVCLCNDKCMRDRIGWKRTGDHDDEGEERLHPVFGLHAFGEPHGTHLKFVL